MERNVIIVAGGKGVRMGSGTPKQFLLLGDKPVIIRSIEKFLDFDSAIKLIVVVPADHRSTWNELKEQYLPDQLILSTSGGPTRFQSVSNGLKLIGDEGVTAIHDAVRPAVPVDCIQRAFKGAEKKGNAIVAVDLKDSIRQVDPEGFSQARDRSLFKVVQTPQVFDTKLLKRAYTQPEKTVFTDDASVIEELGVRLNLVEGDYRNLKITTAEDLQIAKLLDSER